MLRGTRIGLRARHPSDLPILLAELHDDVDTRSRADARPWTPKPPDGPSPYDVSDAGPSVACFSIVELESDELVGEALLWSIDLHNRLAHIGISLRPGYRGRGLSTDVVTVLCRYGFEVRGLHRLQIDTLADNHAMRRAAETVGFTHEATLREAAWVLGEFVDEVAYGLIREEWLAR